MNPTVSTSGLTVGYRHGQTVTAVLSRLDLALTPGRMTVLLGANGRGKSTILRTLSGVQKPLSGDVLVEGRPIGGLRPEELARKISIVYTDRTLAGAMTVAELVALGRQPHTGFFGRLDAEDREVVRESMEAVGVGRLSDRYVATLSDGERQKTMIARALAQDSPTIILDEPTAFLDVAARLETFDLLASLAHDRRKAILLSTHDVTEALASADETWIIPSGENTVVATPVDEAPLDLLFPPYRFREGRFSR